MAERFKINKRSLRLFATGSSASGDVITSTTYDSASASFADNVYITDTWDELDPTSKKSSTRALMYVVQRIQEDVDDLHSEVSKSVYEDQVNSGSFISEIKTFTDRDATPSVQYGTLFKTGNSRATSITDFDDGQAGQQITIIMGCDNTGFTHDTRKLYLSGGSNVLRFYTGDTISFVCDGDKWYETNRSDNT